MLESSDRSISNRISIILTSGKLKPIEKLRINERETEIKILQSGKCMDFLSPKKREKRAVLKGIKTGTILARSFRLQSVFHQFCALLCRVYS